LLVSTFARFLLKLDEDSILLLPVRFNDMAEKGKQPFAFLPDFTRIPAGHRFQRTNESSFHTSRSGKSRIALPSNILC